MNRFLRRLGIRRKWYRAVGMSGRSREIAVMILEGFLLYLIIMGAQKNLNLIPQGNASRKMMNGIVKGFLWDSTGIFGYERQKEPFETKTDLAVSGVLMQAATELTTPYRNKYQIGQEAETETAAFFLDSPVRVQDSLQTDGEGEQILKNGLTQKRISGVTEEKENQGERTDGKESDQNREAEKQPQKTETPEQSKEEEKTESVSGKVRQKVREISEEDLTYEFLMKHYYTVVSSTTLRREDIDAGTLMHMDMKLKGKNDKPQILVYHTHGQEGFTNSVAGNPETGIVGVGNYLVQLLQEKYGYHVIHITDSFDYVNGVLDRSKAYDYAYEKIAGVLAENPSIEVVIDLHRDGVGENTHLVTEIDGKQTAQIMFFNGISRLNGVGEIGYLYNPYRSQNLAMSLQMKVLAEEYYPGFTRRNYIQAYQYNLHLRPKSMLIEAGAQTNSFEEVKNAMEPLAELLHLCLSGDGES